MVRNQKKKEQGGRKVPPVPNQVPISARGIRRREKTAEFLAAKEDRKKQSYGHRRRGNGCTNPGPKKGPTKRPGGISQQDWYAYMEGKKKSL